MFISCFRWWNVDRLAIGDYESALFLTANLLVQLSLLAVDGFLWASTIFRSFSRAKFCKCWNFKLFRSFRFLSCPTSNSAPDFNSVWSCQIWFFMKFLKCQNFQKYWLWWGDPPCKSTKIARWRDFNALRRAHVPFHSCRIGSVSSNGAKHSSLGRRLGVNSVSTKTWSRGMFTSCFRWWNVDRLAIGGYESVLFLTANLLVQISLLVVDGLLWASTIFHSFSLAKVCKYWNFKLFRSFGFLSCPNSNSAPDFNSVWSCQIFHEICEMSKFSKILTLVMGSAL